MREIEVTLNQNMHQFFTLAPQALRGQLHASKFDGDEISAFDLFGRDVDKHFALNNVMQPDLLFLSDSTVFSIEMKIAAKCRVSQVLKYALLGLAVELKTAREHSHCLLTIAPAPFSSLWRERIHNPAELREAMLAVDPAEFLVGKNERYRKHIGRFREIVESMAVAHTTYAELSRFLSQNGPDDTDLSLGAEVYGKLIAGLKNEFALRKLLVATPAGDGAASIDENGKISNARLHEQMTEGVDDSKFRAQTRLKLLKMGIPREDLARLFADLPQDY